MLDQAKSANLVWQMCAEQQPVSNSAEKRTCPHCQTHQYRVWLHKAFRCEGCAGELPGNTNWNPERTLVARCIIEKWTFVIFEGWNCKRHGFDLDQEYELAVKPFFERPYAWLGVRATCEDAMSEAEYWFVTLQKAEERVRTSQQELPSNGT